MLKSERDQNLYKNPFELKDHENELLQKEMEEQLRLQKKLEEEARLKEEEL